MPYRSKEDFVETISEVIERVKCDKEVTKQLENGLNAVYSVIIKDFRLLINIIIRGNKIFLDWDDDIQPNAIVKCSSKIFHRALSGKLNYPRAIMNKALLVRGDTSSLYQFNKLTGILVSTYCSVYDGRNS